MMLNVQKSNKFKNVFAGLLVCGIVLGAMGISVSATTSNNNSTSINLVGKSYEEAISIIKDSGLDYISEEFIYESMKGETSRGAIVAIDIETGEVLSMINFGE